jgi:hypothetical protein
MEKNSLVSLIRMFNRKSTFSKMDDVTSYDTCLTRATHDCHSGDLVVYFLKFCWDTFQILTCLGR